MSALPGNVGPQAERMIPARAGLHRFRALTGVGVGYKTWLRWLSTGAIPSWTQPGQKSARYWLKPSDLAKFIAQGWGR
jgi:hypothetical protein